MRITVNEEALAHAENEKLIKSGDAARDGKTPPATEIGASRRTRLLEKVDADHDH